MNNSSKGGLIQDGLAKSKDLSLWEWPVRYQLVGSVMDYQGYDV